LEEKGLIVGFAIDDVIGRPYWTIRLRGRCGRTGRGKESGR